MCKPTSQRFHPKLPARQQSNRAVSLVVAKSEKANSPNMRQPVAQPKCLRMDTYARCGLTIHVEGKFSLISDITPQTGKSLSMDVPVHGATLGSGRAGVNGQKPSEGWRQSGSRGQTC